MQRNQSKPTNTHFPNRSGARKSGKTNNQTARRERVGDGEEYRTQRRELWFTIDGNRSGSYRFDRSHFPIWFKQVSSLYEKFKFNRIRLHFETGYPSTAQGQIFCSYNTGLRDAINTNPAYIAAQRGALSGPVYRGYTIVIPQSAYSDTPGRRPCRGTDEETYIFDAVYAIAGDYLTGSFSVYIDYDVTFYTPQLTGEDGYASFYANSPDSEPQAVVRGDARISRQEGKGFVIDLGRSYRDVLVQVAVNAAYILGSRALSITTFDKNGTNNGLLEYTTTNPGTTQASTVFRGVSSALVSGAEIVTRDGTTASGATNSYVHIPDGGTARTLNQTATFSAADISSIRIATEVLSQGGPTVFATIFGY